MVGAQPRVISPRSSSANQRPQNPPCGRIFGRLAMAVPYEPFGRIRTGSQNPVLQVLQAWKLIESWQFSKHQIYEVYAAIMREIWISGLTTEQKLTLASPLARWLYHNNPDRLGEGK